MNSGLLSFAAMGWVVGWGRRGWGGVGEGVLQRFFFILYSKLYINLFIDNLVQDHYFPTKDIQLFRQRLSKKSVKAYATMPKGSLGNTQ